MSLIKNYGQLARRVSDIEKVFYDIGAKDVWQKEDSMLAERAAIQLQNEWERFVRNFVLDSATGKYAATLGKVVSQLKNPPNSREQAAHMLIQTYKRRKYEPDWHKPEEAIKAADNLKLSNFSEIAAVLGTSPWPLTGLKTIRSFVAHQSKNSAIKLRLESNLPNRAKLIPVELIYAYSQAGVQNYLGWTKFINFAAKTLACN